MLGEKAIFIQNKSFKEGVIVNITSDLKTFFINDGEKTLKILENEIVEITNTHQKEYEEGKRPLYSYSTEELMVLWDPERTPEKNLFDITRYILENSTLPKLYFWKHHLGDHFYSIKSTDWRDLKNKALLANGKTDLSKTVYVKNQHLKLILKGRTVLLGTHALERCFERFTVRHENLITLISDIISNSVQKEFYSKTQEKENVIYLHNQDFDWAFVVSVENDTFFVMTMYQPNFYWRNLNTLSENPLLEPII